MEQLNLSGYYNTTNESGQELKRSIEKANSQDEIIFEYFKYYKCRNMAAHEIHKLVFNCNYPITSIRRALTNLTAAGYLKKSKRADCIGPYGKKVYTWRYNFDKIAL